MAAFAHHSSDPSHLARQAWVFGQFRHEMALLRFFERADGAQRSFSKVQRRAPIS